VAIAPHDFIRRFLMPALPQKGFGDCQPSFFVASLRRTPHSDMTYQRRLFSKATFDDIIVRRPVSFGHRNPLIEQRWLQAPAHLEEET
jgi:hypothetical protein